jgi:hypothetical protein
VAFRDPHLYVTQSFQAAVPQCLRPALSGFAVQTNRQAGRTAERQAGSTALHHSARRTFLALNHSTRQTVLVSNLCSRR